MKRAGGLWAGLARWDPPFFPEKHPELVVIPTLTERNIWRCI